MSQVRICKKCRREIDADKRADAIFCNDQCRVDARVAETKRRNCERKEYELNIRAQHAPWLQEFEKLVRQKAPENAVGYQAGLWVGNDYLWFPIIAAGKDARGKSKTRLTFNRTRSTDEFFLLKPFEPPSVPLATHYQIRFVSRIYPYPPLDDEHSFIEIIPYEIRQSGLPIDNLKRLPVSRQKR